MLAMKIRDSGGSRRASQALCKACGAGDGGRERMREIEVKYRVEDLEALQAALKARGIELGDPVFQDDQAYTPVGWQWATASSASPSSACAP
jgi:hypothetical protein